MTKETYDLIENYMLSCMEDSAHDKEHIYRVLFNALEIAKAKNDIDYDVLITACLLHDIGRREQFDNPALCHAIDGSSLVIKSKKERGRALRFLFLFWSEWRDSNSRHPGPKPGALPAGPHPELIDM